MASEPDHQTKTKAQDTYYLHHSGDDQVSLDERHRSDAYCWTSLKRPGFSGGCGSAPVGTPLNLRFENNQQVFGSDIMGSRFGACPHAERAVTARWPNPLFDPEAYRQAYFQASLDKSVYSGSLDLLLHYIEVGRHHSINPCRMFDVEFVKVQLSA